LELVKRGFVSYHFNMVWLVLTVLISGSLYAIFKASPQRSGIFSKIIFLFVIFGLFFIFGAQIKIDLINPYVLSLILVINIGLAGWLVRPKIKKE
jgi:tryptophan-rich sensory protein